MMDETQKRENRIWRCPANSYIDYYNFKSKKELPKGVIGDIAFVNHRVVIWNPHTSRWNYMRNVN